MVARFQALYSSIIQTKKTLKIALAHFFPYLLLLKMTTLLQLPGHFSGSPLYLHSASKCCIWLLFLCPLWCRDSKSQVAIFCSPGISTPCSSRMNFLSPLSTRSACWVVSECFPFGRSMLGIPRRLTVHCLSISSDSGHSVISWKIKQDLLPTRTSHSNWKWQLGDRGFLPFLTLFFLMWVVNRI